MTKMCPYLHQRPNEDNSCRRSTESRYESALQTVWQFHVTAATRSNPSILPSTELLVRQICSALISACSFGNCSTMGWMWAWVWTDLPATTAAIFCQRPVWLASCSERMVTSKVWYQRRVIYSFPSRTHIQRIWGHWDRHGYVPRILLATTTDTISIPGGDEFNFVRQSLCNAAHPFMCMRHPISQPCSHALQYMLTNLNSVNFILSGHAYSDNVSVATFSLRMVGWTEDCGMVLGLTCTLPRTYF